mmetsp:Transcript_61573/g.163785  ORF Transcript_61573/g.163785 Transcript_61573/m.163785 type:complete len:114 (-) Transcript_61573:144-485(-)
MENCFHTRGRTPPALVEVKPPRVGLWKASLSESVQQDPMLTYESTADCFVGQASEQEATTSRVMQLAVRRMRDVNDVCSEAFQRRRQLSGCCVNRSSVVVLLCAHKVTDQQCI